MRQRHSIDLLFSLSLFMVFVLCAFLVLLFQINGYHSIMEKGEKLESVHTPLAYVQTQIRAHDEVGAMELFKEQDIEGIRIIDQETASILYIYEQEHKLKELRVLEHVTPDFTIGSTMFEVNDFKVSRQQDVFEITLVTSDGEKQSLKVAYHSQ